MRVPGVAESHESSRSASNSGKLYKFRYEMKSGLVGNRMTQPGGPLRSDEIHLRPVLESDLPILFEHQREPEANAMAAFPARDREAFMAHWKKILGDANVVAMAVIVDKRVVGHVGCWKQDDQRLVGYWIAKEYWGLGVATEMLSKFLCIVNDRPLYAHVVKHNVASIRVLEKCRFEFCKEETAALEKSTDGIEELVYKIHSVARKQNNLA